MKFRITRQEFNKRKTTRPVGDIVIEQFGKAYNNSIVHEYYVDFKLVHTKDLVRILQRLTIFSNILQLKMPTSKTYARLAYLELLKEYTNVDFTENEIDQLILYKNQEFLDEQDSIIKNLKQELSTREHIPNKKQSKIIRRLKAQGKHVID